MDNKGKIYKEWVPKWICDSVCFNLFVEVFLASILKVDVYGG